MSVRLGEAHSGGFEGGSIATKAGPTRSGPAGARSRGDLPHGPSDKRAGGGGVPFGPVQCPQFSPPFQPQQQKAAAEVTPAEAFLDFAPAWHLRQPSRPRSAPCGRRVPGGAYAVVQPLNCEELSFLATPHPGLLFHIRRRGVR